MKLDSLTRYDREFNRTKLLYGLITLAAVIALPIMYYWSLQQIEKASSSAYITDPSYRSFLAIRRPLTLVERAYQYESHARDVWEQMWNVDKNTLDAQVNLALRKADQSLEAIYKEYFIEKGLEQKIKESNWSSELTVASCHINADTFPITGLLQARWRIVRPGGSDIRHLDIQFSVQDAGIAPENPYGAILREIDIIDNTRFEENTNDHD
jgi:hypothetical protein